MDTLSELLREFDSRLQVMQDSLDGNPPVEHLVEVGTALFLMSEGVKKVLEQVKGSLRQEGLRRLQNQSGVASLDGSREGSATVTVPPSQITLGKDADLLLLKRLLGENFDLCFETVTTTEYKPRKVVTRIVAEMPDGPQKTYLLSCLTEAEGTPRVSFKRK